MSTFGQVFRVTTAGESHCRAVTVIVDGCPPGLALTEDDIQPQLTRRRPGQSALSTPRSEDDLVEIQSGTEFGVTLGTPIAMRVMNKNQRPGDYSGDKMELFPRPSHADWTYLEKYGVKASSGGGRSSARETIARVAAGAIADKVLRESFGVDIVAFVASIGSEHLFPATSAPDTAVRSPAFHDLINTVTRETVDAHIPVRSATDEACARMQSVIEKHRDAKDSVGGTVACVIRNIPQGLGEPVFDRIEAKLAHAMLSIPSTKGFQIGSGYAGCALSGSKHNDPFVVAPPAASTFPGHASIPPSRLTTSTNHSGGAQGGITNGTHVYFDVAFKPPATIAQAQQTAGYDESAGTLEAKGRHDPCVVPRALPIVESMAAMVVLDALLLQNSRLGMRNQLPPLAKVAPSNPLAKMQEAVKEAH